METVEDFEIPVGEPHKVQTLTISLITCSRITRALKMSSQRRMLISQQMMMTIRFSPATFRSSSAMMRIPHKWIILTFRARQGLLRHKSLGLESVIHSRRIWNMLGKKCRTSYLCLLVYPRKGLGTHAHRRCALISKIAH